MKELPWPGQRRPGSGPPAAQADSETADATTAARGGRRWPPGWETRVPRSRGPGPRRRGSRRGVGAAVGDAPTTATPSPVPAGKPLARARSTPPRPSPR